ncbi:MAG: hypothetical protein K9G44_12500, partial [Melioribacteraceae bacterium]|nr:hypothetical protein [Melioribacteraceae bacterium]
MKRIIFTALLIPLFITSSIFSQNSFKYTIDLRDTSDDLFIVEFTPSKLTNGDSILSFVAFAPGAHQPLNFGRFVVSVSVNYKDGNVEQAFNKSTNDYVIEDPENVESITYLIKDSFDADVEGNSIHAMSGTGITKEFIIINNFGVLAYFAHRKDDPVTIELLLENNRTVGTALEESEPLKFDAESYYHAADSPILVGDLSKAGKNIDGIDVEVFVYSPTTDINAEKILELSDDVFPAASKFMGFQPVDRYVMLMYFFDLSDQSLSHLIQSSGALEHSYSSTYALPAMPQFLPRVKSIVSHEYMHILTPLHLRSEIIANWDYSKPTSEDDHLWLYEGVTDWVSYIMMLRSG